LSAPLSVVIPTLDAAERIGPCLGALGEGIEGLIREVILADGGSSDAIARVADATGARLVTTARGRGTQLAAGARSAQGEWLLFLHADTVLAPGWAKAVRRHISGGSERAGYFRLRYDSDAAMAGVIAAWANLRSRAFRLPYGDHGLLVASALYARVGGHPEVPLMEDVAIARRLGRRLVPLDAVAVTSAERYLREGWVRQGARNLSTLALWFAGASPERLARRYRR
jgi:rSAM/selenodomain-associated transferase 2